MSLNVYRLPYYDNQIKSLFNTSKEQDFIINSILDKFENDNVHLISFKDNIEIETHDEDLIYMYCSNQKETDEYIKHLMINDENTNEYLNKDKLAKYLNSAIEIIDLLEDISYKHRRNYILYALKNIYKDDISKGETDNVIRYINTLTNEEKSKILGFNSYEIINDEYTIFYNNNELSKKGE